MTAAAGRRPVTNQGATVLVVADGDVEPERLRVAADRADRLIAADGAAGRVLAAGRRPDLVVGDGDSLDPADRERLVALDVAFRDVAADKDESDTELCLLAALETGARSITIIGALGGARPEHGVANLLLLADERLDDVDVELLAGRSSLRRIGRRDGPGRIELHGTAGDLVSLLPLAGTVAGITTEGLRYPLARERLEPGPARGLSNVLTATSATITTERGRLLVVTTPADVEDEGGPT